MASQVLSAQGGLVQEAGAPGAWPFCLGRRLRLCHPGPGVSAWAPVLARGCSDPPGGWWHPRPALAHRGLWLSAVRSCRGLRGHLHCPFWPAQTLQFSVYVMP